MSTAPPTDLILWLDLPVIDLNRAITFYKEVLCLTPRDDRPHANTASFQFSPQGNGLTLILTTENSDTVSASTAISGTTPYFACVNTLEATVSRAKLNGGTILQDVHSMEPFGFRAVVLDSEGNRIALHGSSNPNASV